MEKRKKEKMSGVGNSERNTVCLASPSVLRKSTLTTQELDLNDRKCSVNKRYYLSGD